MKPSPRYSQPSASSCTRQYLSAGLSASPRTFARRCKDFGVTANSSGLIRTEKFQVSGDSVAVPKLSAKCCAATVAHSSQMKTLLLSGPRLARKASQPPQPPTRDRTSCRDFPQNEQVLHGTAARVIWEVPSISGEASTSPSGISSPPWAGSLAERVFQSAKPNCRATISRHVLCESEKFRSTRESRRDFAIVLAFFCVSIV